MKKHSLKMRILSMTLALLLGVSGVIQPNWVSAEGTEAAIETETFSDVSAETDALEAPSETEPETEADIETEAFSDVSAETEAAIETETFSDVSAETDALETPSETEPAVVTDFAYKDDDVSIEVTAGEEAGFLQGTELKAKPLEEGSVEYQSAFAAVEAKLDLGEDEELLFVPYDIFFTYDGSHIEPEADSLWVKMVFNDAVPEYEEDETVCAPFVAHVKDNGDVELLENKSDEDDTFLFEVKSFSVMGPVVVVSKRPEGTETEAIEPEAGTEETNAGLGAEAAEPESGTEETNQELGTETTEPESGTEEVNEEPGMEAADPEAGAEETDAELSDVEKVIAMIDALPDMEEISETLDAYEKADDEEGSEVYLTELHTQALEAYEAYQVLTDEEKEAVTNKDKLMELSWLWDLQVYSAEGLYISEFSIDKIQTGTAPFDSDNEPGNDADDTNLVVRTFDSVLYDMDVSLNDRSGAKHQTATFNFEITLEKDMTEAMFNVDLFKYLDEYTINLGSWGHQMHWGQGVSSYPAWTAPGNTGGGGYNSCYNGGTWNIDAYDMHRLSGVSSGPFTITVQDYDFDLDSYLFPARNVGDASTVIRYHNGIGCFASLYMQVLLQYDEKQINSLPNSTSIYMKSAIENFSATSMSSSEPGNVTVETTNADNTKNDAINVKNPGSIQKYNSFSNTFDGGIANGYLGIAGSYWAGECGDPASFAGSALYIKGAIEYSRTATYVITDMNYLQVFDSTGLSIDTSRPIGKWNMDTMTSMGDVTILYAADPDYAGGYDTNADSAYSDENGKLVAPASRMYGIHEDDLIYFDTLDALQTAGYTCIGVMFELRGCYCPHDGDFGVCIPVIVTDEPDMIDRTVCTTNLVRAWTDNRGSALTYKGAVTKELAAEVSENSDYSRPNYLLDCTKSQYKYIKTEYADGNIIKGTHLNGKTAGMSLLVLGYKAGLKLNTVGKKEFYDLDKRERTADYVISGIRTMIDSKNSNVTSTGEIMTTDLTITLNLQDKLGIDLSTMAIDGQQISTISEPAKLIYTTTIAWQGQNVERVVNYTVYYEFVDGEYLIHLDGVPVGVGLPDITFSAAIGKIGSDDDVHHGDTLKATARITGTSDRRAYSENAGNESSFTIEVNKLAATSLVKNVSKDYAELNEGFDYDLKYANNGNEMLTNTLYLYDILPFNGDSRGSSYTDESLNGHVSMTDISLKTSGNLSTTDIEARLYYSMLDGTKLSNIIEFRNMPDEDTQGLYLKELMAGALADDAGNLYFYINDDGSVVDIYDYNDDGVIIGTHFTEGSNGYVSSINISGKLVKVQDVSVDTDAGIIRVTGTSASWAANTYQKVLIYGGYVSKDNTHLTLSAEDEIEHATCIFVAAKNLAAGETIDIDLTVTPYGNKTADYYANSAHSWIAGVHGDAELDSNIVDTRVVTREISGVVWYDLDADGVRDDSEALLSGVTCTLFKKQANGSYLECKEDVTGKAIASVTTGQDGTYRFIKLSSGDYVVAFKGSGLAGYDGATSYQVNGRNDNDTNDGVLMQELDASGITGYDYAIRYSVGAESIKLHDLLEISNYLNSSYIEEYANQDLGVVRNGSVTVSKTVAGSLGDKTKSFHFELRLSGDLMPESLTYTKGVETGTVTLANGIAEFTLAHGEMITFSAIPSGLTYEVVETDGKSNGYDVESVNASGTVRGESVNVSFTNTKEGTVPTSADVNTKVPFLLALLATTGIVWFFYRRKKVQQ